MNAVNAADVHTLAADLRVHGATWWKPAADILDAVAALFDHSQPCPTCGGTYRVIPPGTYTVPIETPCPDCVDGHEPIETTIRRLAHGYSEGYEAGYRAGWVESMDASRPR